MTTRRLAAILSADVMGFSAMMERDEEGTAARIRALRREVVEPALARHQGRLVKTTGDGFLAEFASPVEAVRSAVAIQDALAAGENGLRLRIGVNLGDIIIEDDGDVLGDGVNIAARLEQMADPGGVLVSGKIYEEVQGKIDSSFESRGEQQVKNLVRPLRVYALARAKVPADPRPPLPDKSEHFKLLPLPSKPSVAVLPFTNMSGDLDQEYFCDGIVEDIITALSRVKWFFVIARNSSFTYKGRAVDVKQVGRELGVRYVLEGSVRRVANRVRITGQLIEAATGHHVWADRYDGDYDDVFELQDRVTENVVAAIEPEIRAAELVRIREKRPESLDAYDYYLQALPHFYTVKREFNSEAIRLLACATERDPSYAVAYAMSALCWLQRRQQGWTESAGHAENEGIQLAEKSLELGSDDPRVLWVAGHALTTLGRQHVRGRSLISRSLDLNSNSAQAWTVSGLNHVYMAEGRAALADFGKAFRLSPRDPMNYYVFQGMSAAHLGLREYDLAVEWADRSLRERPGFASTLRYLAAALAYSGDTERARLAVRQLLAIDPGLTVTTVARARTNRAVESDKQHYLNGLRLAGLPD